MNGWSWLRLHNLLNPIKQETAGLSEPQDSTSSSQASFTAWLCLGISKPSTSSSHLRFLYISGRVAWAKQVGVDLGTIQEPQGQGTHWTATDHIRAPPQLILHGRERLVVSDHSHSLQLTGLGKFLLLICQKQPRLNYKRMVYSARTKSTPHVHNGR